MVFRGGLADLRRMPAAIIDEGPQRTRAPLPAARDGARAPTRALPVLLVPPLAAPAICFDLRRGCSLAEHLVQARPPRPTSSTTGTIAFSDRDLGPRALGRGRDPECDPRGVSEDAGGRPCSSSAGASAGSCRCSPSPPTRTCRSTSIALVASPFDFTKVPLVAPIRADRGRHQGRGVTALYRLMGGAPAPLVKRGYQLAGFDKYLTKPWTMRQQPAPTATCSRRSRRSTSS